jgi:membrane protease YdiL (CAAX protease family)
MSTVSIAAGAAQSVRQPKATTWLENILLFGIPAVALYAAFYWISPAIANSGTPLAEARYIAGDLVMGGMVAAAIIGFLLEQQPATWRALSERFRLNRMTGRTWAWTLGGIVVYVILALAANALVPLIYRAIAFTPPIETAEPFGRSAIPLVLFSLLMNILGEEIWWRGYILPRQELQFGRATWLVHGILWACFHAFKWWTIPAMMIVCSVVPFVALKTRNTYPGMVLHLVVNGLGTGIAIVQLLLK